MLIATSATVLGYAIDAGHKELTHVFAGCYIAGCVIAVLAVRQSGVFTAVIQPPLLLFCAVPGAYWLFHGGKIKGVKDLLINCGYPLIERFPLMLGTAGVVLLIGLVRWYFGMTHRSAEVTDAKEAHADTAAGTESKSFVSGIAAKLASMLHGSDDAADAASSTGSQPAHGVGRAARASPKSSRAARSSRSAQRPARSRSRHSRAALQDQHEPTPERRRRRSQPPHDFDAADPPRRARRQRPQGDPDSRSQPPREARRDPHGRRGGSYERPPSRSSRFDPYDAHEPPPERFDRYEAPADRYESYQEPRRRPTPPPGPGGANSTHHPISQVRYRGSAPRDERREPRGEEPRPERRSRSRAPRRHQAESWEYDI